MRRFKAFTLTELMIALAVIGVLVAVVTPAIMRTRPNKNKMMIKKTFYETEKIVNSLINDETLYIDGRDACNAQAADAATGECLWGFDDFHAVKYDGETYGAGAPAADADADAVAANRTAKAGKFAGLFGAKLNWKSNPTDYVYVTSDGVKWDLSGTTTSGTGIVWQHDTTMKPYQIGGSSDGVIPAGKILIDVNGDEGPNCRQNGTTQGGTACAGSESDFDQYQIEVFVNGKMRIDSADTQAAGFVTINTSLRDSM